MNDTEKLVAEIEELLLELSAENHDGVQKLIDVIQPFRKRKLPSAVGALLADNMALIIEDMDLISRVPVYQKLLLELAGIGVNSMHLRDALAVLGRQLNPSFPDPAGLIRALGIFDQDVPILEVRRRWDVFAELDEGCVVWHDSYGLGKVVEIDSFSDLVCIQFQTKQHFSFVQAMTTLSVARKDSFSASILSNESGNYKPAKSADEFDAAVSDDFVPTLSEPSRVVEQLLVPYKMNKTAFNQWRLKKADATESTEVVAERQWNQARSLEELKSCLAATDSIVVSDADAAHLAKLFQRDSRKVSSKLIFGDCITILWERNPEAEWLIRIISELPEDVAAWTTPEAFIENIAKLPAKRLPFWFNVASIRNGEDWLIDVISEMPYRFWGHAEKALSDRGFSTEKLYDVCQKKMRAKTATADVALWLWRQQSSREDSPFSNPVTVFKMLAKPVKGEYIKARKEVFKMLMDDPEFQKVLMDNGSNKGISSFAKAVKNMTLLSQGEQQSLLVKIVRLYPEALEIVEDRQKVVGRRPLPKVTSIRTFEEKRKELAAIINEKVPQNSAAIAHARSYGDLRENAEFKAAKEEQRFLMTRRRELEMGLKDVRSTDFSDVSVFDTIIPGCSVGLEVDGAKLEVYHLLGLWDSMPEDDIISYDTPLGKILVGKKVGDEIETPQKKKALVKSIDPLPAHVQDWVVDA